MHSRVVRKQQSDTVEKKWKMTNHAKGEKKSLRRNNRQSQSNGVKMIQICSRRISRSSSNRFAAGPGGAKRAFCSPPAAHIFVVVFEACIVKTVETHSPSNALRFTSFCELLQRPLSCSMWVHGAQTLQKASSFKSFTCRHWCAQNNSWRWCTFLIAHYWLFWAWPVGTDCNKTLCHPI